LMHRFGEVTCLQLQIGGKDESRIHKDESRIHLSPHFLRQSAETVYTMTI
jgi:hypothetical protein